MAIETGDAEKIQSAKPWHFKPGKSGNPSGRPRGSQNKTTLAALPLTAADLAKLEELDKPALVALIKRAAFAGNWGILLKTDDEIRQMLMDKLKIYVFTSTKPRVMLAAMKLYLDRTIGRPARAVQKRGESNSSLAKLIIGEQHEKA